MAIILQLPLCLHELHGLVISVDGHLFAKNIMLILVTSLDNGIHFICNMWGICGQHLRVSHCDIPLDGHVE